jgi:hypothetical protein
MEKKRNNECTALVPSRAAVAVPQGDRASSGNPMQLLLCEARVLEAFDIWLTEHKRPSKREILGALKTLFFSFARNSQSGG